MLPLMEMMLNSQNGEAFSQLQNQFGLNPAQAESALEAMLPAFSTGLKRNTAQPMDMGAFMQSLSTGQHARYIDDSMAAFSSNGIQEGNGILGHLFGSKDISRAVASQASQVSGVGEDIIRKMLPVVASMVMGGLFKQSTGQVQNFGNTSASNLSGGGILGQILGELAKGGFGGGGQTQSQPRSNNPMGDILEQMMGGGSRSKPQADYNPLGRDNPLGKIFEDMLGGKQGQYQPREDDGYSRSRPQSRTREDRDDREGSFEDIGSADRYRRSAPRDEPKPRSQRKSGGGLEDLFGDMFETGRDVNRDYQRNVESIFDQFMKR